ncbi:MAG: PQQ-binding-like beta-propeller repeat protein [Melioribacteraceae bacterium]|nr:PQQ-binding-like beta-propeller repeat protein [Melioribacteraceae bacterium]
MKALAKFVAIFLLLFTSALTAQWIKQESGSLTSDFKSVEFLNLTTGFTVGSTGLILKTTDSGTNWIALESGVTSNLNSLCLVTDSIVIAVGEQGTILRSSDQGESWSELYSGSDYNLMSVEFFGENAGWVVGTSGKIFRSTDGGLNWTDNSYSDNSVNFNSVFFVNADTGWIAGSGGMMLYTVDGGNNWTIQNTGVTQDIFDVFFINSKKGRAVGSGNLYLSTEDGGTNWTFSWLGTISISSVFFLDENLGWIVGSNILETTDGGENWEEYGYGLLLGLNSIQFRDQYTGWAVGDDGLILHKTSEVKSLDLLWKRDGSELPGGGYTWSTPLIMENKVFWAGQDFGFAAFDAETGDTLWIDTLNFYNGTYDSPAGYDGKVFVTRNDYMNHSARSLLALDANTGEVIWQKNNFSVLNRSAKPIVAGVGDSGTRLYAATDDTLYCLTADSGTVVWKKAGKYSNLLADYNSVRLIAARSDQASIELLYLHNGELISQINLPDSDVSVASMAYTNYMWKEYLVVAPGTRDHPIFYCIDIADQNVVWESDQIGYVGNKSMPVIYGDKVFAGVEKIEPNVPQEIVAFSLTTGAIIWRNHARGSGATNTPYVIALDDKIYYHSSVNYMNTIASSEMLVGIINAVASPGFKYPWPQVWGSPLIYKNKLYVAKDGEGLFCYNAGSIVGEWTMLGGNIHATNSYFAQLTDVSENEKLYPVGYELLNNYPNPFNPATVIAYKIPEAVSVSLKVYDVLGNEIAVLVDEYKQAGYYETEFNAQDLSSGVYFCRIEAGVYSQMIKMLLLK